MVANLDQIFFPDSLPSWMAQNKSKNVVYFPLGNAMVISSRSKVGIFRCREHCY